MIKSIIDELNEDNGSNYKMDVLRKYTTNETLKQVLKMTYCKVDYTFGVTMKNVQVPTANTGLVSLADALVDMEQLVNRSRTGNEALAFVKQILGSVSENDSKIIQGILNRDQRINMGRSNINKVFKNLIVKPPYMRCGIYGEKTAKKINFPALVQLKADGSFCAATVDQGRVTYNSRSGEERQFPHLDYYFNSMPDGVYIGELLVYGITNRSLANGVLNSDNSKEDVYFQLWDYVSLEEYSRGKDKLNKTVYKTRFQALENIINEVMSQNPELQLGGSALTVIPTEEVNTLREALEITSKWMQEDFEGSILKDFNNIFVDHTSPTQLKLKLEIDAEVRVTGFTQGKVGTKREATFGAITFESDDGTVKGQTSGFTDEMILELHNNRDKYIGKVMTVQFNDITKGRDNDFYALSHPRFVEFRDDKDTTDTLERMLESKEMAMTLGGK